MKSTFLPTFTEIFSHRKNNFYATQTTYFTVDSLILLESGFGDTKSVIKQALLGFTLLLL